MEQADQAEGSEEPGANASATQIMAAERRNESAAQFSESRLQTICLLFLSGLGFCLALYWLKPVLVPLLLALFLMYCLVPVIEHLHGACGISRGRAVFAASVIGIGVLVLFALILSATISQFVLEADLYKLEMKQKLQAVAN
jgi:AI-2 transport protein TqsA